MFGQAVHCFRHSAKEERLSGFFAAMAIGGCHLLFRFRDS